ncbi:hypothetical protein AB0I60_07365 [Actinosynnema sp. NPDC050436]|uniref:STAS domain-containing protein n=1 Tax=Actinosynnema sp. NPDC050436 TaxID=3155659 RepID=UPI0033EDD7BA
MREETLEAELFGTDGVAVLSLFGMLNGTTHARMRDLLLKTVLAQPTAVVVDLGNLAFERATAAAVLRSVWHQVAEWPGVPILVAPADRGGWPVPGYPSVRQALDAVGAPPRRRVVRLPLPLRGSAAFARLAAEETCRMWDLPGLAPDAADTAGALVGLTSRGVRPTVVFEWWRGKFVVGVGEDVVVPCDARALRRAAAGARRCGWSTTWSDGTFVWAVLPG